VRKELSRKIIDYKNNKVAIKVTELCGEMDLIEVLIICARRGLKVKGMLTCKTDTVGDAKKRLIKGLLIS
jgi:hypothetical protein